MICIYSFLSCRHIPKTGFRRFDKQLRQQRIVVYSAAGWILQNADRTILHHLDSTRACFTSLKQGSRETAQGLAPVIGACENPKNTVMIRDGIPVSQSATAPFRCIIAPCILQGLFIRLDLLDFLLGFRNHAI